MQTGEGVSLPMAPQTLVECEWRDCKKTHQKKPAYPKGGKVTRSNGYAKNWIAAKLEPWELYGAGKNPRAILPNFRKETTKAPSTASAVNKIHPEYVTQKHHLISINLFEGVPQLSDNAKLVGYDANHKNNGICLPYYTLDIVQHDLQRHAGRHSDVLYNDKIKPQLRYLEIKCIKYCEMDASGNSSAQMNLVDDLDFLSRRIEKRIKNWTLFLSRNSAKERIKSEATYEKLIQEIK